MTIAHAADRCRAAFARYQTAQSEIAMLDALPPRDGFMRTRKAERRDLERKAAFAVREMRAACRTAWVATNDETRRKMIRAYRKRTAQVCKTKEAA